MPEPKKNETPDPNEEQKNKDQAAGQGDPKDDQGPSVIEKDGKIIVDKEWYNALTSDMKKYKVERNELKTLTQDLEKKLSDLNDKEKKAKEDELKKQNEFKTLYEQKEKEVVDMNVKFNEFKIETSLKQKAIMEGIQNPDDIVLADKSQVKINEKGEVQGVDEAIASLKEKRAYLFKTDGNVNVDQGKGGKGSITFADLMKDGTLALKVKKENPALYAQLREQHLKGKTA